jgi:hypothetical protein
MDIKDVCYIGIVDSQKKLLYSYNYQLDDVHSFINTLDENNGPVYLYKDQLALHFQMNDISVLFLAMPESNELFVSKAAEALIDSLSAIIKNWCVERIAEKYDQIILLFNEFVFRGIILTDNSEELSTRILKRTFENMSAIKVNKGFASFLNKAAKSFKQ